MGRYFALNLYLTLLRVAGGFIILLSFIAAGVFLSRWSFAQFDYIPPIIIYCATAVGVFLIIMIGMGLFAIADVFQAILDTAENTAALLRKDKS